MAKRKIVLELTEYEASELEIAINSYLEMIEENRNSYGPAPFIVAKRLLRKLAAAREGASTKGGDQ